MNSDCIWIQVWVELPTAADVNRYRRYLDGYAAELHRAGRPVKPPTRVRDLREWLVYNKVVPDEIRIASLVAFGFLMVCLVNAVALLLARFSRRNSELAIRRALGAPRSSLFAQCLIETAGDRCRGRILGLVLTFLGLAAERATLPRELVRAAQLDVELVAMTLGLAILATVAAGLYPAWRSSRALERVSAEGAVGGPRGNRQHHRRAPPQPVRRGHGRRAGRADSGDRVECDVHGLAAPATPAGAERSRRSQHFLDGQSVDHLAGRIAPDAGCRPARPAQHAGRRGCVRDQHVAYVLSQGRIRRSGSSSVGETGGRALLTAANVFWVDEHAVANARAAPGRRPLV